MPTSVVLISSRGYVCGHLTCTPSLHERQNQRHRHNHLLARLSMNSGMHVHLPVQSLWRVCAEGRSGMDLFKCREAAARALAEDACDALAAEPPDPPFQRAQFKLTWLTLQGHTGAGVEVPPTFDVAVEPGEDIVSSFIRDRGMHPPHPAAPSADVPGRGNAASVTRLRGLREFGRRNAPTKRARWSWYSHSWTACIKRFGNA